MLVGLARTRVLRRAGHSKYQSKIANVAVGDPRARFTEFAPYDLSQKFPDEKERKEFVKSIRPPVGLFTAVYDDIL